MDGRVNERGTHADLKVHSKFVTDFVTEPEGSPVGRLPQTLVVKCEDATTSAQQRERSKPQPQQSTGPAIMQDEERFRGGVGWRSLSL